METVSVDAQALRRVLQAMMGPSHHAMELWATQSLPGSDIAKLVQQFNDAIGSEKQAAAPEAPT